MAVVDLEKFAGVNRVSEDIKPYLASESNAGSGPKQLTFRSCVETAGRIEGAIQLQLEGDRLVTDRSEAFE